MDESDSRASSQVPNQRKKGRCLDSGSEKLGESPHHQLKKSLFKLSVFRQPLVGLGI